MKSLSKTIEKISQAMSVKFNMAVYDLQRQGKDIVVLSLGEAFFKLPLFSFQKLNYEKGFHYSSSWGLLELRQKISQYYFKEYGVTSSPDTEILISAGSKIIIYMVLASIINPGDEIIIIEPTWVSYPEQVRIAGGKPIAVSYKESLGNMNKYITAKTKAIIINNPQNPSGRVLNRKELEGLFDLSKQRNLYLLSDEAYSDFVSTEPFISIGAIDKKKERSFIVNSLSKCMGMSGLRIGYVISSEKLLRGVFKLNQHLITCPTTLIEQYAIKYFDEIIKITRPQIKRTLKQRQEIAVYMDSIGLNYLSGSGTFYFMVSIAGSALNSEDFAWKLLRDYNISTVPGIGYGKSVGKFLRLSVGAESLERIKKGLDCIKKLIAETKK